jgi:hypothetical protein
MSNLNRGPSIDASNQVSFDIAVLEEKNFRNQPTRNKNFLWWPSFLIEEISKLYRRPSIAASYQVMVHLAKWFQRRRFKCEKLTDDRLQAQYVK